MGSLGSFHQLWISKEEWEVSMACARRYALLTLHAGAREGDRWTKMQVASVYSSRFVCFVLLLMYRTFLIDSSDGMGVRASVSQTTSLCTDDSAQVE